MRRVLKWAVTGLLVLCGASWLISLYWGAILRPSTTTTAIIQRGVLTLSVHPVPRPVTARIEVLPVRPQPPARGRFLAPNQFVYYLQPPPPAALTPLPFIWRPDVSHFTVYSTSGKMIGTGLSIIVPVWIPLLCCGLLAVLLWWLDRGRTRPGHCAQCGYDLTGNVSGTCPECGKAVANRDCEVAISIRPDQG